MAWSFDSVRPVYKQIAEKITMSVLSGEYCPGRQIPSVRQLALEAAVNPNTVQRSFLELESLGIIEAQGTTGRFVTTDLEKIEENRKRVAEEIVGELLKKAELLKLSPEQIIKMIEEEKK